MTTKNLDTLSDKEILEFFLYRCLLNPAHKAVVVHEIVPRSQRPKTWRKFENRVALCHECHDKIHREGNSEVWKDILTKLRSDWVKIHA